MKRSLRILKQLAWSGPLLIIAISMAAGCTKRPGPVAIPTQAPTASSDESAPAETIRDPNAAEPVLMAYVEPTTVAQGESTLLVWEATNATQVLISQGIGPVVPEGQIKIYPDQTTTYRVRAEGPGGSTEQLVTVEVTLTGAPSSDPGGEIPLQELFSTYIKPVFFGFDSAELSQEAKVTLDGNIRWLRQEGNSEIRFSIEGHCDQRGTEEYNLALGDKRARVVRDYLVRGGVAGANIVTVTMGEESPFATGDSEETHALNRRAHFVLIPSAGSPQNR